MNITEGDLQTLVAQIFGEIAIEKERSQLADSEARHDAFLQEQP
jgi:hypothetical protein